ncbi:MAG TPA: glycosyltransferase family 39 protein, partial [Chloroflexia bacterium]
MIRGPRRELWLLGGILLLAALARYTGLTQGFPRDFHWDERIYFHEALYGLANGLRRESTVSANLPYLLMPWLLAQWLIATLAGQMHGFGDLVRSYIVDPAPFLAVARAAWAATGVISVAAVYRLGRRMAGPAVGLVAAFFLAAAFLHVAESHFIKNDVPAGLMLLLALDACFNIQERGARRDYFWAGFWLGLASATKYYAAGVAPVILLAHFLRREPAGAAPSRLRGLALLGIALGGALLAAVASTPVAVIDPRNLWDSLSYEFGAHFGSIPTDGVPQWMFYLTEHLGRGMGAMLLGLALIGIGIVLTRRTPKGVLLAAVPVLFFIALNLR